MLLATEQVPDDVQAVLDTAPLGGGGGEAHPDGRWWSSRTVTGPDRVEVADDLAARLRALGHEVVVRHHRH